MEPFEEWKLSDDKRPAEGDVFSVTQRTIRERDGIQYEVHVGKRSLSEHAFEEGEDQQQVWALFIPFGNTDATCAGGYAFVQAARKQQEVADAWALRVS